MKVMCRAALMVAVFVFLLPLSARSEIKAGSVEMGVFGGYTFFENTQNLKAGPIFGGRIGYNFTRYFGIEAAGEYIHTRVDDRSKPSMTEGQYGYSMDSVDLTFYHVDLVYHFMPDGKFNPFVLVGFGGTHYSPAISRYDMAAFNVGVGAKYWLTDNIALRVDLKDYIVTEIMQSTYNNPGVTIGITYAFGGKAKTEPAPVAKYEPPPPPPKVEEKVIILAAEPKVEEKVVAAVAETKVEEKVVVLAFEDVHFDFDKSTLTPEAKVILKRDIQLLKDNPKAKVRVAGYTSASGTEEYNQKLSERRAKAVQEYLISEGVITRDRLSTIGYGEKNPATYEAAPKEIYSEAAKSNMRVLFEIVVQPEPANSKDRSSTVTPNPEFQALLDRNLPPVKSEAHSSTVTPPDVTKASVEKMDSPLIPSDVTETNVERKDSPLAAAPSRNQSETQYTIQIKSFPKKGKTDAVAFVETTKKKRPDVQMETVTIRERGVWHRIVVGSFSSQEDASKYMKEAKIRAIYPGSFVKIKNT